MLLWFALNAFVDAVKDKRSIEPLHGIVSFVVAALAYRLVLKPAGIRIGNQPVA